MAPKREVEMADVPSSGIGSRGGQGQDRERGRVRGRGRGRGRGERATRESPSSDYSPHFSPKEVEFLLEVLSTRRRWVRLPDSFAHVMAASPPSRLWLRSEGCPHGPIWVVADFSENGAMYSRKGWKKILCSKNIPEGRTIFSCMMAMKP